MNRLSMTVADRGSVKRISLLVLGTVLLAACYLAFMPMRAKAAACAAPSTDYGTASTTITVDTAATYRVWSRLMAPDTTNNSYLLEIDGNTCYTVGDNNSMSANTWTWVDYQGGATTNKIQQSLTVGNHTVKMIGREAGAKLGRVIFVSDLNCVPVDNGDNCAVAGDTEVPQVNVSAPAANASVANTVNITANASDNVGVSRVDFYVNGVLKSTDGTSPYSYGWDTKTSTNGLTSLMAKAYDAAGNSNSDTIQVNVANGDTQAPSVPAGVIATADAANKVTVKWTASTDNTGIAGYWIVRNGQTLGKVTTGAQYVDTTVMPNTAYSYRVSAYDAAGNTSALSTAATATTPNVVDTQAPSAPTNLKGTAKSSTQINLNWASSTDNIGVAAYDVYRSVGTGTASKVASVNTLSYGDTGLTASTGYSYYVIARDAAGNASQQSTVVSVQTFAKSTNPGKGKGKIYGQVRLSPSQTSKVTLTIKGLKRVYTTDSRGYYYITDVPEGTYYVKYESNGYFSKVVTTKIKASSDKVQDVKLRRR